MEKSAGITSKEVILKAASQHELINKQSVIVLAAVTNKLDEVGMTELAEEVDLGKPFTVALEALLVEDLDGNRERLEADAKIVINVSLVDGAEAAFSEYIIWAEALSDGLKLKQSKRDHLGIRKRSARVVPGARSGWIAQI